MLKDLLFMWLLLINVILFYCNYKCKEHQRYHLVSNLFSRRLTISYFSSVKSDLIEYKGMFSDNTITSLFERILILNKKGRIAGRVFGGL